MSNRRQWISKAEDVADEVSAERERLYLTLDSPISCLCRPLDQVFRRSKAILPTIARLCLVSTFIEDGLHIRLRWSQGRNYMDKRWGHELATLFVSINMLSQLIASGLELTRYHVTIACGLLFCVVGLRTLTFGAVWNPLLWPWALNLCGALLLLLAECQTEAPTLLAGVPSDEQNRPKAYLLFTGRILTLLIFFTSLSLELRDMENVFLIIRKVIVLVLVVAVTIGYKTKPSALLLVVWLTG
ncbi:unnamed protein product [Oppiella nova]|uniref:Uncharacterized protein n=1 Tax=Oppiella nova TaxID=334625 RepID=A0A7R9QUS8_9ACAR|nr:unnamed protein product [Oppiella nova]CAG2176335.1 unnamed protein product [Oppiella nova]